MSTRQTLTMMVAGASVIFTSYLLLQNLTNQKTPTDKLERFLEEHKANLRVRNAYRFAQENPQHILLVVKCYCGCLKQDHNNNHDCFFNEDGGLDLMGLNCGLCVNTALLSKQMWSEGKSVEEIAAFVDNKWGSI